MKPKDEQIIKSTLNTLIKLTYQNMIKSEKNNQASEKDIELLIGYRDSLLKMIDEDLFT